MRPRTRWLLAGASVAGAAVSLGTRQRRARVWRHGLELASRRLRYLAGRLEGARYRLGGRRPDPKVDDHVLADRIRSELGGLEHRLDLPRVHVMVDGHVAKLHGEVARAEDAEAIVEAVAGVSGVAGVESFLHVGLIPGDARPSEGSATRPPSRALVRLRKAVEGAGVEASKVDLALGAVLAAFAARLPEGQRAHVAAHLPADVRARFVPAPRADHGGTPRRMNDFAGRVAALANVLSWLDAKRATVAVLEELARLVPDDVGAVAAVLPPELRTVWEHAAS
jgi:uncharacterized protein (DUF2267 family)